MGCATSKVISPGLAFNKQGTPYKFWPPLGCSKIEDISMHITKRTGNSTLPLMERESSLTNHRLLHPEDPHDPNNLSLDRRQSVSSAQRLSVSSANSVTHKEEKEMINNSVDECVVRNHEEVKEEDEDDFRMCPCSPSFKVYVKACNIIDKSDGSNRENKPENMKEDKNLMKTEQVKQLQNEDPTSTSNVTLVGARNSLNKSSKGRRFQRPTLKSLIGVATRSFSNKHRKSFSNKDNKDAKVKVE